LKVGVRAHDFGRMGAEELARVVSGAGFSCVQLAPTKAIAGIDSVDDVTDSHLETIQAAFSRKNVEITVFGCYVEPSLEDKEERLKNVANFQKGLAQAKRVGASLVGTETTGLDINAPDSVREEAFQRLKDSVLRMVETAEKEDMIMGIEPVAEHTLNTPALARRLLDEVGSNKLKIIFDPVNLILPHTIANQNEIFKEVFELLGEEIVALHVKDIVIEGNEKVWRNIGTGVVSYGFIFEWLSQKKPDMRLLREGVNMDSYKDDHQAIALMAKMAHVMRGDN